MTCPHCKTGVHISFATVQISVYGSADGKLYNWSARHGQCPECKEPVVFLLKQSGTTLINGAFASTGIVKERMVEPGTGARPCPPEVPSELANDFSEAAAVLGTSPQASAALTRRSLQHLLRDYAKTKAKDLADQIDEVIGIGSLPSSLSEQLDAVRNIGNFAAHVQKSKHSGEILPVEPEEAEWNLDVLEELFDHFFVKPAKAKARKDELNKKLAAAGKTLLP